nr:ribonuclease H-like domain-containing protein [Tanacetum cinerariifolium]
KKEEDSKALVTVDTLVDWTNHYSESDGVIDAKEFGMIDGCDSDDSIKEGATKLHNLINGANSEEANTTCDAGKFALMGVTSEWRNSSKNLFKLIDSSMSVRTKVGLGFTNCIGENDLGWDDSAFSVFSTNSEDVDGRPIFHRVGPAVRPQPVPPGKPKATLVLTGKPKGISVLTGKPKVILVPTGKPKVKPVPTGKPKVTPVPTDTECLVLSKDFQLPDDNMVVLKVHRKHNLYTINLNDLCPRGNLACLVAHASFDESVKWHRRMAHVNYKNMNSPALGTTNNTKDLQTPPSAQPVPPGCIPVPTGNVPVPTGSLPVPTGRIPVPAVATMVPSDDVPVHSS